MTLWRWLTGERRHGLDVRRLARSDPWQRLPYAPPLSAFGPGLQHDFDEYLAGDSRVVAGTPTLVAQWLLECRYAEDALLLDEHDHWQHPCTFEVVRSGDCEDYALWAWRKLVDAAYEAEFVVGMHHRADGFVGRHAWVVFRDGANEYVLDGVQRSLATMVRDRRAVATEYVPQVGVTSGGRRFVFAGLFQSDWGRRLRVVPHESR